MREASKMIITISDETGKIIKQIKADNLITMARLAGYGEQVKKLLTILGIK